jgi:hypothetical protein
MHSYRLQGQGVEAVLYTMWAGRKLILSDPPSVVELPSICRNPYGRPSCLKLTHKDKENVKAKIQNKGGLLTHQ